MSDRWYYQLLMEEFGPVSEEYVLELLHDGTLGDNELVRNEQGGDWITISAMKESLESAGAVRETAIEEIQDLSELNFKFETSSSVSNRPTAASVAAASTSVQSPRSDTPAVPKPFVPTRDSKVAVPAEAPVRKRTTAPVEAKPAVSESVQPKSGVASGKRKRVVSDKETPKVARSKRISSNGTGVEDELSDDIFNDVFQKQDTTPQKSLSATASMSTSPTSAGFSGTGASRDATATPSSMSSNTGYSTGASSSASPVSKPYSASPGVPAAPPRMVYTPPKKSVSVSEPMDLKKVGTVAGAITAIAGVLAISIFGLPFGSEAPPDVPFDPKVTAAILQTILKNFNDLTMTSDPSAIAETMDNLKPQMAAILAITQDPKNNTPEAAACQAATKALMKIADSMPDKQEGIEEGVAEFQKQMALVQ